MKRLVRGSNKTLCLVLLSTQLLVACGGGNQGVNDDANSVVVTTTGESLAVVSSPTKFDLNTDIVGDTVPGQKVSLLASGETDKAETIEWRQTGGPTIILEKNGNDKTQFRIPPISHDTSFSFVLIVTDGEGHHHKRHVHVEVKALTWKHLKVVEPELADNFVVFRANKDNNLRVDLYRADLDGTNIMRLNGPLVPGGNVHSFSISPDGQHVVYLADEDNGGVFELYMVSAMGGDAVKVSGDLVAGGNLPLDFLWSPDSVQVAFRADKDTDEMYELFTAFSDGSAPLRLSGDMTPNGDVVEANFFWSDDSSQIAYRANQFNDNTLELFVSSRDGTNNQRVSMPPVVNGGVLGNFAWIPGGSKLAYIADQKNEDVFELFVVGHDGSGHTQVSGPLVSGGSVLDFQWSPDGAVIAYRAEQQVDEVVELFSVNPDGTDNTLISALTPDGDVGVYQWQNGVTSNIAYLADQDSDDVVELYVAGADGASNHRVSGPLISGGDVTEFAWSPDNSYLVYRADQDVQNVNELYSSTADGTANVKISGALGSNGNVVLDWKWSNDSAWIVYRADQRNDEAFELFSSSPDGGTNLLISGSMVTGGDVGSPEGRAFQLSSDSTRVVYSADQQEDERFELFVTAPDSGIAIAGISGPLTSGGDVRNFALSSRPGILGQMDGVQTNLPEDALLGWEQCYSSRYDSTGVDAIVDILDACSREYLLMACRPVGDTNFTVAAWGPRAAVTADTGTDNVTTRANDVEWYFNESFSWGFAAAGDEVDRNSCDLGSDNADQRLCWHTSSGNISAGWRCGADTGLFDSDWERLLFHRGP